MYDEERYEEKVASFPRHIRERFQPDGMSAPPDCEHPRVVEIVGDGKPPMYVCLDCGAEVPR